MPSTDGRVHNSDLILQFNQLWDIEGIVSKHRNATYRSGHTDAWM